jgi:ABC-2 type transport system ATP-binding protein
LLDEPTTGLDPEARRSVWRILESLRGEGRGILLTTHYIEEAEYLANRVAIISRGRFVAAGTVEEVRRQVRFRGRLDVRNTDRLAPTALAELEAVARRWPEILRTEAHVRFGIADPFSSETVAMLSRLTAAGVAASLAPASLEDAYLELVGEEIGNGT